jgi:hypothetical protein
MSIKEITMKNWLFAGLLVLSSLGIHAAEPTAPPAPTVLSIPVTATAPVIDGSVGEGEWVGPQMQGFFVFKQDCFDPRGGWVRLASDGKTLFLAMQTQVHPRYGAVLRNTSGTGIVSNDAMEMWLSAGGERDPERLYQLLIDAADTWYGQNYELRSTRWTQNWRPRGMTVKSTVGAGLWTLECAIPLAAIDVKDASQGVRIRIGRNYKLPFTQTITQPLISNYIDPATMLQVRIGADLPVVEEPDWQNGLGDRLTLINPHTKALTLRVNGTQIRLDGGQRRQVPVPVQSEADDKSSVSIRIESGTAIIHRRILRWKTTTTEVWEKVL